MKKLKNKQTGAAIIIYLLIMAIVVSILMVATYSRLLLALKRGQSTTDTLIINYAAESEVNDWIARLSEGLIKTNPFSVHVVKPIGNTTITVTGSQVGDTQTIVVEADRPYASTKITAERTVETLGAGGNNKVDIMIGLDCTSSMDITDAGDTKTRIANLKDAALSFVSNVPKNGNFRVGVFVFGIDGQWLKTATGQNITLENNVPLATITQALEDQFGVDWDHSPVCKSILNGTSVGTGFVFGQEALKATKFLGNKQIDLVITDGEPNSRIPYAACKPSVYCPTQAILCNQGPYKPCAASGSACTQLGVDFMRCSVTDMNTNLPGSVIDKGVRDPSVGTYAVTISTSPNGSAATALSENLGENYFPAARAGQLKNILSNILTDILTKRETITIHKNTPGT